MSSLKTTNDIDQSKIDRIVQACKDLCAESQRSVFGNRGYAFTSVRALSYRAQCSRDDVYKMIELGWLHAEPGDGIRTWSLMVTAAQRR